MNHKHKLDYECYNLKPPYCNGTEAFSACFFIRYSEEEARLQHVFTYRLSTQGDVKLTVKLYSYETNRFCNISQARRIANSLTLGDYREVGSSDVSVRNLGGSLHEYVAVLFDEPQLSVVNLTVHSALSEFLLPNLDVDIVEQWSKEWFDTICGLSSKSVLAAIDKQLMELLLSGDKLKDFLIKLGKDDPKIRKIQIPSRPCLEMCATPWSTEQLKTQLALKLQGRKGYEAAEVILQVCLMMSSYILQLSDTLETVLLSGSGKVCRNLKKASLVRMKSFFDHSLIKSSRTCEGYCVPADISMPKTHRCQAKVLRKHLSSLELDMNVVDASMFEPYDSSPVFFEDCLRVQDSPPLPETPSGVHLIVLVHGLQGSSYDFQRFKNYLTIFYPDVIAFCSQCNEGNTGSSIELTGERLSIEVFNYIEEWVHGELTKISFIGHSIGGLIVRAALPHMEALKEKMYSYISLSSPHLGCLYSSSALVSFGLRIFSSWYKCVSLTQLTFKDADDIEETFIYRLSCYPGLSWFRNVVFVSSCQDKYVPFDSARNEIPDKALKDRTRGKHVAQMVDNFSSMLTCSRLLKIDIDFKFKERSIDSVIGRAAHLNFIDDCGFIRQFLVSYPELFN